MGSHLVQPDCVIRADSWVQVHVAVGKEGAVAELAAEGIVASTAWVQRVVDGQLDPIITKRRLLSLQPLLFSDDGVHVAVSAALLLVMLLLEAYYVFDLVQLARGKALDVVGRVLDTVGDVE